MELETFIDEFDCAALDLEEFANQAQSIIDCPELADAVTKYLAALAEFEDRLEEYIEVG